LIPVLVIKYSAAATEVEPAPKPEIIYSGHAKCFEEVWQSCAEHLPGDLMRRYGRGYVFVGRDTGPTFEQSNPNSPFAKEWLGTEQGGTFHDFLKRELTLYFPQENDAVFSVT
jgi:hypothetical protein